LSIEDFYFDSSFSAFFPDKVEEGLKRVEKALGYKFEKNEYDSIQDLLNEYNDAVR